MPALLRRCLCLLVLSALTGNLVQADGWTQRRGHGYYKMGFRMVRATHYYEPGGNKIGIPTVGDYVVSFYGEYGLTNRLTAVAYLPFFERITLNKQIGRESGAVLFEGDAVNGIADAEAGLRFGLLQGGATVFSLGLKLGLPIGNDRQENALLTGDGEFNQLLTLEAGHSFYPAPAYAKATIGFNNHNEGYSDAFVYAAEAGYTVAGAVTLVGRVRGVTSLENGDEEVVGGMAGLYANNQRYLSYGVEVNYTHSSRLGFSAGVDGAAFGEAVLAAPAFSVGLFLIR